MVLRNRWASVIDVKQEYSQFQDGDITIDDLAKSLAAKIRQNKFAKAAEDPDSNGEFFRYAEDLLEIAECFEHDVNGDVDEYDEILNNLYDLADVDRRIWIATR